MISRDQLINLIKNHKIIIDNYCEYRTKKHIADMLSNGVVQLKTSEWVHKIGYKTDKPSFEKDAGSFDGCYDVTIAVRSGKLMLELDVYDGDSLDGHRTYKKCVFYFEIMHTADDYIQELVQKKLKTVAKNIIEQQERLEYEIRLNQTIKSIEASLL